MNTRLKNLLKNLEKTRHLYWNIDRKTGQFLNLLIQDRRFKTVIEIGTSNGYSALWLAEALTHTGGHLITIESHKKDRYGLALENFAKSGLQNISAIPGHAPQAIPKNPKMFDMVFFDATKHETPEYFEALKNRVKKDGLIITDNASTHQKDLRTYLKTMESLKNWHCHMLNIGSGLLVSTKIA